MIDDSIPWKKVLFRKAGLLEKRRQQRRWPSASLAALEQDVFVCAYTIRKLLDAHKVSDELVGTAMSAVAYTFRGTRKHFVAKGDLPDFYNWHRLEEFYDLTKPEDAKVGLREFCNQLVHSWIFMLCRAEDGGMDGYFVASDRERARRVLYFGISATATVVRAVATDDIIHSEARMDADTGQWRFIVRSRHLREKPGK